MERQLPILPEDPCGRLPKQGAWVRTESGAEGRYVGRTKSGLYWVWYPRLAKGAHPVSFEKMRDRFEEKRAKEVIRVKVSALGSDIIDRKLECLSKEEQDRVKVRLTYVEGPRGIIEHLGSRIEEMAWDDGETTVEGLVTENEGSIEFARKATTVARLYLGRKLQGQKISKRLLWQEVCQAR